MDKIADSATTSWHDVDELISILRSWGICYLVRLEQSPDVSQFKHDQRSAVSLIQRLAQCQEYPRVRDASISLYLLHPELASAAQQALQESEQEVAEQIAVLVLATLYLQRLWSIRLALAFGRPSNFPEQPFLHLWESKGLPAPACHNGIVGLLALQEAEQKRTGLPFTFIGDWQNQIDQLLFQEEMKHHPVTNLSPILALLDEALQDEQEPDMSMRPAVDKAAIEAFLQESEKSLDVFCSGFYSIALSKIERGNTRDIADVKLLVQQGIIRLDELDKAYKEVLAQLGKGRYPRIHPQRFKERYEAIRKLL